MDAKAMNMSANALLTAYSKRRSDCLAELADLKKPLLPHELKLIARLLDMASDSYGNHGCNDFDLDNTQRMRDMIRKMLIASDPDISDGDIEESLRPHRDKLCVMDWMLMDYLAHRVREMLAEEEE